MEIIKLNLIPSGVNPTCHCSQYDKGRVIRIELFDGLEPYELSSGDVVTLNVRKPDNTIITTNESDRGNNYIEITTTEQMCACVGYNLCDLTITNQGSKVIGTLNFIMAIERDVLADGIPSQSVIKDLDELVQEAVGDNYYTKPEVNTALDNINAELALKANSANVYTKSQTDGLLALKADKTEVYNTYPTDTASGSIASFTDGADNIPVKSLIAYIEPTQAGSGDPSPSNIRTISGKTSCKIKRTNKNLLSSSVTTNNNSQYKSFGSTLATNNPDGSLTLPAGTYTISVSLTMELISVRKDASTVIASQTSTDRLTFVLTEQSAIKITLSRAGDIWSTLNYQLELGSTATIYTPSQALDETIDFNQTVYGGTLNVDTGILKINKRILELTGSENWQENTANTNLYYFNIGVTYKADGYIIGDRFKKNTAPAANFVSGDFKLSYLNLNIKYDGTTTVTAWKNWLSINKPKFCIELNNPQTVQLTAKEIKTLLGYNNIFADTGDVDVVYRADIGLYIDKKISQIPTALNSTRGVETLTQREDPSETPTNDEER